VEKLSLLCNVSSWIKLDVPAASAWAEAMNGFKIFNSRYPA
jgi:hypothetical protein